MINAVELSGKKMFAILDNDNIVVDCWIASTLEEAKEDNLGYKVIEVTEKNNLFTFNEKWEQ